MSLKHKYNHYDRIVILDRDGTITTGLNGYVLRKEDLKLLHE